MHSKMVARLRTKFTVCLLGACVYSLGFAAQSAEPRLRSNGTQSPAKAHEKPAVPVENLRLQLAQSLPMRTEKQHGMGIALDRLVNADECDDDDGYGNLIMSGRFEKDRPVAASRHNSEPLNGALLAKLEPVTAFNDNPAKKIDVQDVPRMASTQKVVSAISPTKPVSAITADAPKPTPAWEIVPADKTLNTSMARWAAAAGWQLVWELPVDYAVEARTTVPGTFQEAVEIVAKSMESAEIPMKAIFYKGNQVLRIVAKGSE